jgi:hypothetical protein
MYQADLEIYVRAKQDEKSLQIGLQIYKNARLGLVTQFSLTNLAQKPQKLGRYGFCPPIFVFPHVLNSLT